MPTEETLPDPFPSYKGDYDWRRRSWTRTPNWNDVPKHDQPINPYSDTQDRLTQTFYGGQRGVTSGGVITWYDNPKFRWNGTEIRDDFYSVYALADFPGFAAQSGYETLLKLFSRIADQKTNLPVMTAESGKTAAHIAETATRVVRAYRSFVNAYKDSIRGNPTRVKHHLKEVATQLGINPKHAHKSWLEYKYGWMPMLMDIKGTAELFGDRALGGRLFNFYVDARGSDDLNWDLKSFYIPFGGSDFTAYVERKLVATYSSRHGAWVLVNTPHQTAAQQMGLTNPASFAWEVIPFSFVLDWFISVGDWLKALTAMNGLTVVKAFRSNVNDMYYTFSQPETTVVWDNGSVYTMASSFRDMRRRDYYRVDQVLTIPSAPEFHMPALSFSKLATTLALLKSGHRGRNDPSSTLRL